MNFGTVVINIFKIFATLVVLATPFVIKYLVFRWDKNKKIAHLRWRPFLCTLGYMLVVTLFLVITDSVFKWTAGNLIESWGNGEFSKKVQAVYSARVWFVIEVNFVIEGLYLFLIRFFRAGLVSKDILTPFGADGEYTILQKVERWVLKKLNSETWFLIGRICFYIAAMLSGMYAILTAISLIPAMFPVTFTTYETIHMIFESGYIYPSVTLLGLWATYYFLEGVKRIYEECPGFDQKVETATEFKETTINLEILDKKLKESFRAFYRCDVSVLDNVSNDHSGKHGFVAELIGKSAAEDVRNPLNYNDLYLNCIDKIAGSEKSIMINGNFFSPFSRYFLRYLSVLLARGDGIVLVCNSDEQIDLAYDYILEGFAQNSSPYCSNFGESNIDFDDAIWKIAKIKAGNEKPGEISLEDKNLLITSMKYLCTPRFEQECANFILTISHVVFVDILFVLKNFSEQIDILNTRLSRISKEQGSLGKANISTLDKVRYICFECTKISGVDSVLKNLLAVEFENVDAMAYNSATMVRCYGYEPIASQSEDTENTSCFNSCRNINVAVNMAVFCLSEGAKSVTLFAEDIVPYKDIAETLAANAGQVSVEADINCIKINKADYTLSDKSVVIVMDSGCNLPATIRKYTAMMANEQALLLIFSKTHLLNDYYLNNIDNLWQSYQIEKIPVEAGAKKSVAKKIFIKANAGGITVEELLYHASFVPQFEEYVKKGDANAILKEIVKLYGTVAESEADVFKYFEYNIIREFDKSGEYKKMDKILLRRNAQILDAINKRDMAVLITVSGEVELNVPKSRISQKFIVGQNFVHDGSLYHIKAIDFAAGKIHGQLTTSSKNDEVYEYLQVREYRLEIGEEFVEYILPTKHIVIGLNKDDVTVTDVFVSVFRAPMDVITKRYYDIDPNTMALNPDKHDYHDICAEDYDHLSKESYRRYGVMQNPGYSSEVVRRVANLTFAEKGALTMAVRIKGDFGIDINKTKATLVVLLNEVIHSMFPSVADSVAVCTNINSTNFDDLSTLVMERQPQLTLLGNNPDFTAENELTIFIVEDCSSELGVISALASSGENILKMLFSDIYTYIEWYMNAEGKSNYLNFGSDGALGCFDFGALHKLSMILGGGTKAAPKIMELAPQPECVICSFCWKRGIKDEEIVTLEDGRKICRECATAIVTNDEANLKRHLLNAKMFMESAYGVSLSEDWGFIFESAAKIKNMIKNSGKFEDCRADILGNSYQDDEMKVYVEHSIPSSNLSELIVYELTRMWQKQNLGDNVSPELAEGHAALVIVQYLRYLKDVHLADVRNAFYESASSISGVGYRKMTQELLKNPQFGNSPFKYIVSIFGKKTAFELVSPKKIILPEEMGDPYVTEKSDRVRCDDITYYYYSTISDRLRTLYNVLLEGAKQHQKKIIIAGYTFEEANDVYQYIKFDHPELFWLNSFVLRGEELEFEYSADKQEVDRINAKIDEIVNSHLAEISDDMSAYEIALHFHIKLINSIDYDTVFLNQEKDDEPGIDYIRTICGPFINGAAVCAGYARAFQYLVQKCGIECAMVCGDILNDDGSVSDEKHAWNVIKIDGEYYCTDITWDDRSDTIQKVKDTTIGFSYFCITTEEILRTRKIKEMPYMPPVCTAKKANYYVHNNLILEKYSENKLLEFVHKAIKNGQDSITFKCTTKEVYNETEKNLFTGGLCFTLVDEANKINPVIKRYTCTRSQNKYLYTITVFFEKE